MKIQTLINNLEKAKQKYGNLDIYSVVTDAWHGSNPVYISSMRMDKDSYSHPGKKVLKIKFNGFW